MLPVSQDVMYVFMNMGWILILLIMFLNTKSTQKISSLTLDQKLFCGLLWATILTMTFDSLMWISDRRTYPYAWMINGISTNLYYMSQLMVTFLWVLYVDYYTKRDRFVFMKRLLLYAIPILLTWVLILSSPLTGWIYYIDYQNVYHRGPYMFFCLAICWVGILYSFFITYSRLKRLDNKSDRDHYMWIYVFPILPIIGAVIQLSYYGLATMWPCCCVSIFLVFINNQSRQTNFDELTGVHTRRYLDRFLIWKSEALRNGRELIITMIDMDGFKAINDKYGHAEGDNALSVMGGLINGTLEKTDIAARYGGDEFVIVSEVKENTDSMVPGLRLDEAVARYNQSHNKEYLLDFSAGTAIYIKGGTESMEEVFNLADQNMYNRKVFKKQAGAM